MREDLQQIIAEAKRLDGLATEGPWIWEGAYADLYSVVDGKYGSVITDGERPDGTPCVACFDRDKEFIALSRTALPALVAEVERLSAENEQAAYVIQQLLNVGISIELINYLQKESQSC